MTVDAVSDLDLSYTPPLGSPWDAVQIAAQAWTRHTQAHGSPSQAGSGSGPPPSRAAASAFTSPSRRSAASASL